MSELRKGLKIFEAESTWASMMEVEVVAVMIKLVFSGGFFKSSSNKMLDWVTEETTFQKLESNEGQAGF